MLTKATYQAGSTALSVELVRTDVLIRAESEIVNFPRLIELGDGKLILPYGRGRHGGQESRLSAFSEDNGATWRDCPEGSPWNDNVQTSGILGYLGDDVLALSIQDDGHTSIDEGI